MKVIILCTQLEGGGAQKAAIKLARELDKKGIESKNCFFYKKRNNYNSLGQNLLCFQQTPISSLLNYIKISRSYFNYLRREKPNVVIAFTHYANILGLIIAFLAGVKTRIASHRNPSWGDMPKFFQYIDKLCAFLNIYTHITAVSKSTKNSFKDLYTATDFERITVVENGIEQMSSNKRKEECRKEFGIPRNCFIIGNIGRLSQQKNQAFLINLVEKLNNVVVCIAGEGELHLQLDCLIKERNLSEKVILLGEIPNEKICDFLNCLDLYLMPSLFEGLSNALIEAMSMAIPVIASDIESQKDVIIDDNGTEYGVVLPLSQPELWLKTINKFQNEEKLILQYKSLSQKRSLDFSVERMSEKFNHIIGN